MRFLHTGALKGGYEQVDPRKSIGGYVSSTIAANNALNGLFPAVSVSDLLNGNRLVRAIVLHNDTGSAIAAGTTLHYEKDMQAYCNWRMAVVELAQDDCGYYMESLSNESSLPTAAIFIDNDCDLHQIELPEIPIDGYYGIWIERTINVNKAKADLLDCEKLNEEFETGDVKQVFSIETIADVGGNLNETWFFLTTPTSRFQFHFNTNANTLPSTIQSGYEPVRIPHTDDVDADQIAVFIWKVLRDILIDRGELKSIEVDNNTVTLIVNQPGAVPDLSDGDGSDATNFTFTTVTAGKTAKSNDLTEGVVIIVDTP